MSPVVPLVDADIANMAMSHLGIATKIASLNPPDQTIQAQQCAFHLPKIRDWMVQSAPWKFAYKYQALVSDASNVPGTRFAFPGYLYAFQYPNDCLHPIAVTTAMGLRFGPAYWSNYWFPYMGLNRVIPKIPFEVLQSTANPGQLAIATDIGSQGGNAAFLFYIASVDNYALWDPMALQALGAYLAHRTGGPLRADAGKVATALQLAEGLKLQALAQNMNAAQQDRERPSPSVMARW
jgi:hypothetical protein